MCGSTSHDRRTAQNRSTGSDFEPAATFGYAHTLADRGFPFLGSNSALWTPLAWSLEGRPRLSPHICLLLGESLCLPDYRRP
ncbi:hypothetical protein RSAG8_10995, partial [Rhizoctonia solani AG-8 WAC10335]